LYAIEQPYIQNPLKIHAFRDFHSGIAVANNFLLTKHPNMKLLLSLCLISSFAIAQTAPASQSDLYQTIATQDSLMFSIVYTCQPEKIERFFTEDLEFYHDKGGLTPDRAAFMQAIKNNFCGEHAFYIRREPVPGTMKVFPMNNYGAVQTGEHWFYEKDKNGKEIRVGIAKYTHIWKFTDNSWRISRVISYDHQPAQ
jgi:hypothetical protein